MTETTRPMRIIQVDYTCDKCGIGTMRHEANMLTTYPPQFPHTCDHCGHTAIFRNSYPAIRYEPADPAVTPAADDRGPGSVAPDASPVATDEDLYRLWRDSHSDLFTNLRVIYNLGREHGAAASASRPKQPSLKEQALARTNAILNDPSRALLPEEREVFELNRRALQAAEEFMEEYRDDLKALADSDYEPAAAPDRPLWKAMHAAYERVL